MEMSFDHLGPLLPDRIHGAPEGFKSEAVRLLMRDVTEFKEFLDDYWEAMNGR